VTTEQTWAALFRRALDLGTWRQVDEVRPGVWSVPSGSVEGRHYELRPTTRGLRCQCPAGGWAPERPCEHKCAVYWRLFAGWREHEGRPIELGWGAADAEALVREVLAFLGAGGAAGAGR
jgi:hypothetical protein